MAPEEKRPLKVFLCHASGDKPPVRDLYKRLTMEGVDAWLDKEKLLPGQDWQVEIPRAVRDADVVVVCLSNRSVTKEGYVQKEIRFALDIAEEKPEGTIFLIPARLEDCTVPERLNRWQWVDLYEENGFIQLLRSLKLRASAVGAVIEAVSYEDTDKERAHRLIQLYTEGLEAFYTEDWDRACRRFQAILSEQPNHKNASEKLEEAQCQGRYAKLYTQATEAYRSENWIVVIPALEELTQKAPNYKDAAQLLRDARKREQLTQLYEEARTLHAARKWQAVVKVFEQISILEPNYPDADGLLASAKNEVVELKRLAELNEQYSHALHEMETGNWYEARRLLEIVHKSQTGFQETEKLLRKVENEILKVEEKRRQNEQIDILYEQAHGLLRSRKWRNVLEKMGEIRQLDEHFPDQDGIAKKAQLELEREEQEAERQNKLAALYAESVRLLKEEKYQEALNKWQEVKAIDPKYLDRQGVQKTSKRVLARQTQPVPSTIRLSIPRTVWFGLGGIGIVAILIWGAYQSEFDTGLFADKTGTPALTDQQNGTRSTPNPINVSGSDNPQNFHLRVNYEANWVESFYDAGHKITIYVKDSENVTIKGMADVVTVANFRGARPGFQTTDSIWRDGQGKPMSGPPDIRPYDFVYAVIDDDQVNAKVVRIGDIRGVADPRTDSITGTILVPWLSNKMEVACIPWGSGKDNTPEKIAMVVSDGADVYSCSWDPNMEWDMQAVQPVGVAYNGPDGHWVANVFRNPHFHVYPAQKSVQADEWPEGKKISATVDAKPKCSTFGMPLYPADNPWTTSVVLSFPAGCELIPGDTVKLDNGTTVISYTIQNLSVTNVDDEANTVSGIADDAVDIWVYGYESKEKHLPKVLGLWTADFTQDGIDITSGTCGLAEIRDDLYNTTTVEWCSQ